MMVKIKHNEKSTNIEAKSMPTALVKDTRCCEKHITLKTATTDSKMIK